MTPRSGSSFLSEALKATGVAGVPEEYFNADNMEALLDKYACSTHEELYNKILAEGTTPNGVFGTQVSTGGGVEWVIDMVRGMGDNTGQNTPALLRSAYPNLKCLFLTRRNKVRQAVSWWKAVQTNQWILREGEVPAANEGLEYNINALDTLVAGAVMREAGWATFFEMMEITPLTVVYEDLVSDFEHTMRNVLDHLGLEDTPVPSGVTAIRKQADALSEEWVQRYREEKQEGWQYVGWNAEYISTNGS